MTTKVLLGFTLALLSLKIYSQYSWQSGPFKTCQIMLLLCLKFGNGSHLTQINIKVFQVVYKALHYQVPIPSLTFYPGSPTPDRCTLAILVMMFFERSWCPIDMWPLSLIEPRHCLKILPNLPLNLLFSVDILVIVVLEKLLNNINNISTLNRTKNYFSYDCE